MNTPQLSQNIEQQPLSLSVGEQAQVLIRKAMMKSYPYPVIIQQTYKLLSTCRKGLLDRDAYLYPGRSVHWEYRWELLPHLLWVSYPATIAWSW